jgi:uncharacterized protein
MQPLRVVLALGVLVSGLGFSTRPAAAELSHPHEVLAVTAPFLDRFWAHHFDLSGLHYASPTGIYWFNTPQHPGGTRSGCGMAPVGNAFYCPLDAGIYLDEALMSGMLGRHGDFAVAFVVAHEWGHHVQRNLGLRKANTGFPDEIGEHYTRQLEQQADCFAGAAAAGMFAAGMLEAGDLDEGFEIAAAIGDIPGTSPFDPHAHGSGEDRAKAFERGLQGDSPAVCWG